MAQSHFKSVYTPNPDLDAVGADVARARILARAGIIILASARIPGGAAGGRSDIDHAASTESVIFLEKNYEHICMTREKNISI